MAEEALEKLEEQLNCSVCLEIFTDPKQLNCNHIFCEKCLARVPKDRDGKGKFSLACPTCRQATLIPERGVAGIQSAFHINHLLEIRASFEKVTVPSQVKQTAREAKVAPKEAAHKEVDLCSLHPKEELKLYCVTCGDVICLKCALKGGKHQSHDYSEFDEAFEKYKSEVAASLKPMKEQELTVRKALKQLEVRCEEIDDQRAATEESIHLTFQRLREALEDREAKLIGRLCKLSQEKLKGLTAQRDRLEATLSQLSSSLQLLREGLGTEDKKVVLKMRSRVKRLVAPMNDEMLTPHTKADIVFSAPSSTSLAKSCRSLGQVAAVGLPDPSACHLACEESVQVTEVGEVSSVTLQAVDFEGKPCEVPGKSFECGLSSEVVCMVTPCTVQRRGQSQYEISYQPTIKGRHQLHIKVDGQHIRGSPFSVAVMLPVEKLGTPILTLSGVEGPWGVAVTPKGEVVVTEGDGHHVSVFSLSGKKIHSFGTFGPNRGQFIGPNGMTVDGQGNILVVDSTNHRLQKFSSKFEFLAEVGSKGSGPLRFSFPTDVAFNPSNGRLYVVDGGNHRIQVLNSDLTFSGVFGKKGNGKGQFNEAWGVACHGASVYVADRASHRVQVFTAEGRYQRAFGKRGQGTGELDCPHYVAVDPEGVVYVSERNNHRISVFSPKGQFLSWFGGGERMLHPHGVCAAADGMVTVCDSGNKRVLVF